MSCGQFGGARPVLCQPASGSLFDHILSSFLEARCHIFLIRLVAKFGGPTLMRLWSVNQSVPNHIHTHVHPTVCPPSLTGGGMGVELGEMAGGCEGPL